jgi:hypothetical protein
MACFSCLTEDTTSTRCRAVSGALDSRETTLLLPDTSSTAYAAVDGAGYLLFWRGGNIMAQPFDSGNLRLSAGAISRG